MLKKPSIIRLLLVVSMLGGLLGFVLTLTDPTEKQGRHDQTVWMGRNYTKVRSATRWNIEKIPREKDPQNHVFRVRYSTVAFSDDSELDRPLWKEVVDYKIEGSDFTNALDFVASVRDESEKVEAIGYLISRVGGQPLPINEHLNYPPDHIEIENLGEFYPPSPAVAPELDAEKTKQAEEELERFVVKVKSEAIAIVELVREIPTPESQVKLLLDIASVHAAVSDSDGEASLNSEAFSKYEQGEASKHGWAASVKRWGIGVFRWCSSIGLFALITIAVGNFILDSIANRIGDPSIAKALGVTLRTVKEESELILPPSYRDNG